MKTQEIKFKGFLINIFYYKEYIGASKITFQRILGGFLRGGGAKDIPAPLSKCSRGGGTRPSYGTGLCVLNIRDNVYLKQSSSIVKCNVENDKMYI